MFCIEGQTVSEFYAVIVWSAWQLSTWHFEVLILSYIGE